MGISLDHLCLELYLKEIIIFNEFNNYCDDFSIFNVYLSDF
jgi:hypothetical protein